MMGVLTLAIVQIFAAGTVRAQDPVKAAPDNFKAITERPANTGQATWHDAETHASEYMGTGRTHVLPVELKAPAAGN
jgi:hypothetical protein